jgi:hypothetical protein
MKADPSAFWTDCRDGINHLSNLPAYRRRMVPIVWARTATDFREMGFQEKLNRNLNHYFNFARCDRHMNHLAVRVEHLLVLVKVRDLASGM